MDAKSSHEADGCGRRSFRDLPSLAYVSLRFENRNTSRISAFSRFFHPNVQKLIVCITVYLLFSMLALWHLVNCILRWRFEPYYFGFMSKILHCRVAVITGGNTLNKSM